jgi:hypothetical protein
MSPPAPATPPGQQSGPAPPGWAPPGPPSGRAQPPPPPPGGRADPTSGCHHHRPRGQNGDRSQRRPHGGDHLAGTVPKLGLRDAKHAEAGCSQRMVPPLVGLDIELGAVVQVAVDLYDQPEQPVVEVDPADPALGAGSGASVRSPRLAPIGPGAGSRRGRTGSGRPGHRHAITDTAVVPGQVPRLMHDGETAACAEGRGWGR